MDQSHFELPCIVYDEDSIIEQAQRETEDEIRVHKQDVVKYGHSSKHETSFCRCCRQTFDQPFRTRWCKKCENNHIRATKSNLASHLNELIRQAHRRHTSEHLHCELTLDDLLEKWNQQKGRCALTGLRMSTTQRRCDRHRFVTNVSIDRIDSSGHYTPDNVHLVCVVANMCKHVVPMDMFIWLCSLVVQHNRKIIAELPLNTKTMLERACEYECLRWQVSHNREARSAGGIDAASPSPSPSPPRSPKQRSRHGCTPSPLSLGQQAKGAASPSPFLTVHFDDSTAS